MRPALYQNGPRGGKEQRRSEQRAEVRQKCAPERLGSALGRYPSISGVPGRGSVEFATTLDLLAKLEFRRVWALKVRKSVVS